VDSSVSSFSAPWAMRFSRQRADWPRVVAAYERHLWRAAQENRALRARTVETLGLATQLARQATGEPPDAAERAELRRTVVDQETHLDAYMERIEFLTDTQADLRRMLLDAHEQLLKRDMELQNRAPHPTILQEHAALLDEQTAWALQLKREVEIRDGLVRELQATVQEQTDWALRLKDQVEARDGTIRELQAAVAEQSAWALQLKATLDKQSAALPAVAAALAGRFGPLAGIRALVRRRRR
jgi:hypothetical protein